MVCMEEYHNKITVRSDAPITLLMEYYTVKRERKKKTSNILLV